MWCAIIICVRVLTENVLMTGINISIKFDHLNLILIQYYGAQKLNFLLSPGWL